MLKNVLYYLMIVTTAVRLGNLIYLLTRESTNLPVTVFVVTSALTVYGIVLAFKRFIAPMRLKQLMYFFLIQAGLFTFNLIYVAATSPLQVSPAETVVVGTFLDLIVACGAVYFCWKRIRASGAHVRQLVKRQFHA